MPERVRLRRVKGWRMPEHTRSVARPTRWANPYRVERPRRQGAPWIVRLPNDKGRLVMPNQDVAHLTACSMYEATLRHPNAAAQVSSWLGELPLVQQFQLPFTLAEARDELAGWNLACYCALALPCHVDVLLVVANGRLSARVVR
jgi:hypothetical protein